jgi:hypothetical protein
MHFFSCFVPSRGVVERKEVTLPCPVYAAIIGQGMQAAYRPSRHFCRPNGSYPWADVVCGVRRSYTSLRNARAARSPSPLDPLPRERALAGRVPQAVLVLTHRRCGGGHLVRLPTTLLERARRRYQAVLGTDGDRSGADGRGPGGGGPARGRSAGRLAVVVDAR